MDIELAQTLEENELLKSLLYCTKRSCNNCGKVNCENFQRQRIDCCGHWVSYKDYIKQLEEQIEKMKSDVISERDEALRVEDIITYTVLNGIIDKWEIKENE